MTQTQWSAVDGIGYDDLSTPVLNKTNPGIIAGRVFKWFGQTVNKVTGNAANQQVGSALLTSSTGTILANSVNAIVVANTKVTSASLILLSVANEVSAGTLGGDTTANRGMQVWVEAIVAGTSFTIAYRPSANMSLDWSCWYLLIN